MASNHYDYIVVGIGGVGSGALYWLSRNAPGKKVLGIEQFKLGHVNGGSQDVSRIIRMCYPQEEFAKLAPASYDANMDSFALNRGSISSHVQFLIGSLSIGTTIAYGLLPSRLRRLQKYRKMPEKMAMYRLRYIFGWAEVERESGLQLVHKTGGLYLSTPEAGEVHTIDSVYESMVKTGTRCELMTGRDMKQKWPTLNVPDNAKAVFDPVCGLVDAALGNSTHQQLAECRGATIIQNTKVTRIENRGPEDLVVHTSTGGTYTCTKVIVTSGAWLNNVLDSVGCHIPVKVSQENVTYFATRYLKYFTKEKFPVLLFASNTYNFYTLPIYGIGGFKIGIDAGGHAVSGDNRTFIPDPVREKVVTEFVDKYVPKAGGRIMDTKVCLYTMTRDRTFVIDDCRRSGNPDVIVCCGAGHAFKFASLFGRLLSQIAIQGSTELDISKFTLDRPAITDPNFVPNYNGNAQQQRNSRLFASIFGKILSQLATHGTTDIDITKFSLDRPSITDPNFVPNYTTNAEKTTNSKL